MSLAQDNIFKIMSFGEWELENFSYVARWFVGNWEINVQKYDFGTVTNK